jgi:secreted trypsin-like serine protease
VNEQGQALCTGTLIGKDTVLTAAHCVDGDPQRLIIAFGTKLKSVALEDRREVDGYIQHPRWRQPTSEGRGDIALVHFKGNLPKDFHPVHLAAKKTSLAEGTTTLMLGYGVTNGNSEKGAGTLRETKTKILKNFSATEIMSDGKSSSVCFGDSGGPAFVKVEDRYVQWGVASSVANQSCNQYSVHTFVIPYKAWIKTATQQLREGSK